MSTHTLKEPATKSTSADAAKISRFFGELFSFTDSLKLIHWHVTGKASYAAHIALDQAIDTLKDALDRIVETAYASLDDLEIAIPETKRPDDYIPHIEDFYTYVDGKRELFADIYVQSIIDDYQEGIKQLLFRLKRLQ
jgi:Family of unknown function (DUF5856)